MLDEHNEYLDKRGNISKFYNNEFYTAIMEEDLQQIEELIEKHGSNFLIEIRVAKEAFWKGFAILPLHLAASNRRVHSMQSLLSAGADTEMRRLKDKHDNTNVLSVKSSQFPICITIFTSTCHRDTLGRTPLHLLITSWPSILNTFPKPDSKFQARVTSVSTQAEACLRLLCEHGVNINAKVEGKGHQTALHLSVRYRALSAVQTLACYGADVNAVDGSGMAPLHMAAGILHKDIIASLIRHGAYINMVVQHTGNTPLHLAAVAMATKTTKTPEDGISSISELLEQGADPHAVNKAGMTPLHEACSMGNEELTDLLLSYGADINKLSEAGESCLYLFLHRPNVRNVSLLVKLLNLTSPLTVYNQNGHLPFILTKPCFFKQREHLLNLTQQPKRLQDICKTDIYLKHLRGKREEVRKSLPDRLYDFVFNHWENVHNISFVTDGEQELVK